MDWREKAACRGEALEVFFTESGENSTQAREICSGCPVRLECLEDALRCVDLFGFRGGMGPKERRAALQLRRRNPTAEVSQVTAPKYRVLTHGYGGYSSGCRCGVCGDAKAEYAKRKRAEARELVRTAAAEGHTRVVKGITHGCSGYNYHGCRCFTCRKGRADADARRDRSKREAS